MLTRLVEFTELLLMCGLLVFAPLTRGATNRVTLCVVMWLALTAFTLMILRRTWANPTILPASGLEVPIIALLLLTVASLQVSIYREATVWASCRILLYLAVFYLAVDLTRSGFNTHCLVLAILGTGLLLIYIGFAKYQGGIYQTLWGGGSARGFSMSSTFMNHNHFAGYLEMNLLLCMGIALYQPVPRSLLWLIPAFIILMTLCLTTSRGAMLATAIASLLMFGTYFAYRRRVRKVFAISVALFTIAILSLFSSRTFVDFLLSGIEAQEITSSSRIAVWRACLDMIGEYPWFGTGLGTFPWSFGPFRPIGVTQRYWEAHNDYLQIITEMGLPILVPLVLGLYLIGKASLRAIRQSESRFRSGVALGALGGMVAILIHSFTDFNIQITSNGILFSCLLGMLMRGANLESRAPVGTSERRRATVIHGDVESQTNEEGQA
jgi:O-antigen ligase